MRKQLEHPTVGKRSHNMQYYPIFIGLKAFGDLKHKQLNSLRKETVFVHSISLNNFHLHISSGILHNYCCNQS